MIKKNKILIIAEAGVNHNGNLKLAKKLIDIASNSKADYVKFQTFIAENLVTKKAAKAKYQVLNSKNKNETQFQMLKKLELNTNNHMELKAYSKKKKIKFLSTPFDEDSFDLLKKIGLNLLKISSTDLTNIPLLQYVSKNSSNKMKILLSTGMGTIPEIKDAVKSLTKFNIVKKNITVLHCTSNYPASDGALNLNALTTMKNELNLKIGYSDHSIDDIASLIAISKGATVIEKHFTISKKLNGPDHKASLNPDELYKFVKNIKRVNKMLGSFKKKTTPEELDVKRKARKSIFAKANIFKGEIFTINNLTIKRPGTGIAPKKYFNLLGKKSKKKYYVDDAIKI